MADQNPDSGTYLALLRAMHRHARPRTYLEIGVADGASLALATRSTKVIGIDPRPRIDRLPRRWSVHAETSDEFFARSDAPAVLGEVDVAFIDGLHLFEQTLRDFIHVERYMASDGVVMLHDCHPPEASWGKREKRRRGWAGDVWKIIPILEEYRPDLSVEVAAAAPTGLGIVTRLDRSNRQLDDCYEEIVSRYMDVPYQPRPATRPGTWPAVSDLFPVFRRPNTMDELERRSRTAWKVVWQRVRGVATRPRPHAV